MQKTHWENNSNDQPSVIKPDEVRRFPRKIIFNSKLPLHYISMVK